MEKAVSEIRNKLFELQDIKYKDFQAKLMPTVPLDRIIGVRTPALRKFSREIKNTHLSSEFIKTLPHYYYEENNLHAFLIEQIADFDAVIAELDRFLPCIDNWATCDLMRPRVFDKNTLSLMPHIQRWIGSTHTYTIRFGVLMLMTFYLDDNFKPEYFEMVAGIKSEEYYVNMMRAWYFATALAKRYEQALPYIEKRRLDGFTHNMAIRKAVESYRITDEQKAYLKTLKVPKKGESVV